MATFSAINPIADGTGTIEPDTPYSGTRPVVDRWFKAKGLPGSR